jgi:hypothetical protein
LALSKRFPDFWTGAFIRVYDLHGTAFDNSPLLKQNVSFMAGIGVAWIQGCSMLLKRFILGAFQTIGCTDAVADVSRRDS